MIVMPWQEGALAAKYPAVDVHADGSNCRGWDVDVRRGDRRIDLTLALVEADHGP